MIATKFIGLYKCVTGLMSTHTTLHLHWLKKSPDYIENVRHVGTADEMMNSASPQLRRFTASNQPRMAYAGNGVREKLCGRTS